LGWILKPLTKGGVACPSIYFKVHILKKDKKGFFRKEALNDWRH
jgi:hypothetical protein